MVVGTRKKLLCTYLLISFFTAAIFEIFIIGNIHQYYLNSISSTLKNKAELASRFYNNFLDFGDIYSNSKQIIDLFAERSFQMQITDKNGNVIADSLGKMEKNNLDYEDVKIALTGKNSEFKGRQADSGEKIYAYTVPLTSNGMIVGTMRFTTSLEQTYQVIYKLTMQLLAFGLLLVGTVFIISVLKTSD
jgi:hypothetical protein